MPDSEHFDFGGYKAYATSYAGEKLDFEGLRKSELKLQILSDDACRKKLDDGASMFDPSIQICTYHELVNATSDFDGII